MQTASKKLEAHALVVIDMQNAFCSASGSFCQRGYQMPKIASVKTAVMALVRHFKQRQLPVLCTRMLFADDYCDAGLLVSTKHPQIRQLGAYRRNTWDSELFDELKAETTSGCIVVSKTRY